VETTSSPSAKMPRTSSKDEKPDKAAFESPAEYIQAHGFPCATVVRIWSAGESDFVGCETYLFLSPTNEPFTAVEDGDDFIVREGWDQFNHQYFK
jgi:hypothetical protein